MAGWEEVEDCELAREGEQQVRGGHLMALARGLEDGLVNEGLRVVLRVLTVEGHQMVGDLKSKRIIWVTAPGFRVPEQGSQGPNVDYQ